MAKQKQPRKRLLTGYWRQSAQPLPSLAFILPMLLAYEGGILWQRLGPGSPPAYNGAAVWLQKLLFALPLGPYILLPAVTCAILLAWHHLTREPWRFSPLILLGMLLESALLAAVLVAVWRVHVAALDWLGGVTALLSISEHTAKKLLASFGAGIYEELLFRMILLSLIAGIVRAAGAKERASLITAIVVSSVLFAAAHYRPFAPGGDAFAVSTFVFRLLAGVFFAVVYVLRGFGIAAGTHALYDVAVILWLQ